VLSHKPFCRLGSRTILPTMAVLLIAVVPLLGQVGCRGAAANASSASIQIEVVSEKEVGPATIEVALRSAQGSPVDGARVSVRGDMNHAGMKPVISEARDLGGGLYRTEDFRFTMGGDWIITAEVTLPDGKKLEHTIDVSSVRSR